MRCPNLIKAVNAGLFISCRLYNADTLECLKSRVSAVCSRPVLVLNSASMPFPCDVFFIPQPGPSIDYTVSFLCYHSSVVYEPTTDTFSIPDSLCKNIEEPGACTDCEYRCICPHFDTNEDLPDVNVDSDELKSDNRCSSIEESLKGELENALKSSGDPIMNSESSACPEKNYPAPGLLPIEGGFWVRCVQTSVDGSVVVNNSYHVSRETPQFYGIDLFINDRCLTLPFEKHFFVPCDPPEAAELLSKNVTAPKSPEEILLEATADLWNSYTKLPEFHPMEFTEVAGAIHHIQGWLAIRLNSKSDNSSFSRKVSK